MDTLWTSAVSIGLGLIAWLLPVLGIFSKNRNAAVLCFFSICFCSLSLCVQIIYYHLLVNGGQWGTLEDTSGATALVSVVFLIITIFLNLIFLLVKYTKTGIPK